MNAVPRGACGLLANGAADGLGCAGCLKPAGFDAEPEALRCVGCFGAAGADTAENACSVCDENSGTRGFVDLGNGAGLVSSSSSSGSEDDEL